MAATTTCLELAEGDREEPGGIARTRTEMARRVDRARMLPAKAGGESAAPMAARLGVDPNTAEPCAPQVPRRRPGGGARRRAREGQAPALSRASKATVHRMLDAAGPRPDRVTYYCERRDPDFGGRAREVLVACQQLSLRFDEDGNLLPWEEEGPEARVVSVDERPGTQALSPTADDPGPAPGVRGGAVTRDHEYRRRGTPALLAGIDLQDGTVEGVVRERHRSREFVELLEALDAKYPEGHVIRLVPGDHSIHRSRETRAWLEGHPGRFEMVPAPTHGSWPDVIEGFFGKMARQMLRHIRVGSLDEPGERIELYLKEVNARPVPHRWTWGIGERAAEAERMALSS